MIRAHGVLSNVQVEIRLVFTSPCGGCTRTLLLVGPSVGSASFRLSFMVSRRNRCTVGPAVFGRADMVLATIQMAADAAAWKRSAHRHPSQSTPTGTVQYDEAKCV